MRSFVVGLFLLIFTYIFSSTLVGNKEFLKSKPSEIKYQKWNQESWIDSLILQYSYFADSTVTIKKTLDTNDNILKIEGKLTEIKDENHHTIKKLWQIPNQRQWQNSYEYLYSYDGDIINSALYQEWINNVWTPIYQGFFDYDENDNCIQEAWKFWQNGILKNSHKYAYQYDDNNNLIQIVYSEWDENEIEQLKYKKTYVYIDTFVVEYRYEKRVADLWQNVYKYEYQYDENNHFQRTDYYEWQNDEWVNVLYAQYDYIQDDLLQELWLYDYSGFTYFYARNLFFYNSNSASINQLQKNLPIMKNYPNPFNPSTTFVVNNIKKTNSPVMKIFNLKGNLVAELKPDKMENNSIKFFWNGKNKKGKNVASGVYFYKLYNENRIILIGKSVLLK